MRKQPLNKYIKLFTTILFCFIISSSANAVGEGQLPVSDSYSDVIQSVKKQTSQTAQTINNEDRENTLAHKAVTESIDNTVNNSQTTKNSKNSVLSNEVKKQTKPKISATSIIFKFLFAMLWVIISSGFIFLILLAYKKLILKGRSILPTYESMEHSLETPKNFKEAIKIFLDKTKWN